MYEIAVEDLTRTDLQEFVVDHLRDMYAASPPDSVYAFDVEALRAPEITLWTARKADVLLACGALRELDETAAELKSMRAASHARGTGVGSMLLDHIIAQGRSRGYHRIYLETGVEDFFIPARNLYHRRGFVDCSPFADYEYDPHSVYMKLEF